MRAGHTQAIAGFARKASKTLVNGHSNKVVNIASTEMVKRNYGCVIPGRVFG